jgi:hypothetical protein
MSTLAPGRPGPAVPVPTAPRQAAPVLPNRLQAIRRSADEGHWVLLFGLSGMLAALLFVGLVFICVDDARQGVEAIGRQAIPSIDAADQAASLLSGMDAQSIDNALAGPGGSQTARAAFLAARGQVDQQVRGMLRASSTGAQDDTAIASLQAGLHDYDVRYGLHTAETRLGFPLGAAQQRAASDLIDTVAIPGALAVDDSRTTFLTDEFVRRQNGALLGQAAIIAGAAGVLAVLIVGQRFMARTYRRLLNRTLVVGTLLVALLAVLGVRGLGSAAGNLRDMALGAHSSIHALQLARVELEHARRDQSLFLLEQGHGDRYDREYAVQVSRAFCVHASAGAAADPNSTCQPLSGALAQQIDNDLRRGQALSGRAPGTLDARYTGYLADALRNVNYGTPELDVTLGVLGSLAAFEQVDAQMRALEKNNQHAEAIALNTGSESNQGAWAFEQVERALQAAVDANQGHYDTSLNDAFGALDLVRIAAPIFALAVVVLIWLGIQPTVSRYRLP